MSRERESFTILLLIALITLTSACVSLAGYDQKAYENATTLKAEVAVFINEAGPKCKIDYEKKIALKIKLESAYEYANGIEYNNEAASNWRNQIDELIGSFFIACREQKLSQVFFDDLKVQINEGFDTIICLEANKREISKCESLN